MRSIAACGLLFQKGSEHIKQANQQKIERGVGGRQVEYRLMQGHLDWADCRRVDMQVTRA